MGLPSGYGYSMNHFIKPANQCQCRRLVGGSHGAGHRSLHVGHVLHVHDRWMRIGQEEGGLLEAE
jgi:hypothetical protein